MTALAFIIGIDVSYLLRLLLRTCSSDCIEVILILHRPALQRRNKVELNAIELSILLARLLHLLRMRLSVCKTTTIAVICKRPGIHAVLEDEINVLRGIAEAIHG